LKDFMRHHHVGFVAACGAAFITGAPPALAGDGVKTAGEILRIALPVGAAGYSLYKQDYDGVLQLTVSEVISVGTSLVLQHVIKEQRPDKSDWHSFPSDSAAVAFSPVLIERLSPPINSAPCPVEGVAVTASDGSLSPQSLLAVT
jgi:hypothetical protein